MFPLGNIGTKTFLLSGLKNERKYPIRQRRTIITQQNHNALYEFPVINPVASVELITCPAKTISSAYQLLLSTES